MSKKNGNEQIAKAKLNEKLVKSWKNQRIIQYFSMDLLGAGGGAYIFKLE